MVESNSHIFASNGHIFTITHHPILASESLDASVLLVGGGVHRRRPLHAAERTKRLPTH